jgi:hypothetical protein
MYIKIKYNASKSHVLVWQIDPTGKLVNVCACLCVVDAPSHVFFTDRISYPPASTRLQVPFLCVIRLFPSATNHPPIGLRLWGGRALMLRGSGRGQDGGPTVALLSRRSSRPPPACPAIYPALLRLRTPARSYHRREVVQVTTNRPSSMTSRGPRGRMNSPTSYGNTVPALSCTNPICSCATTTDNGVTHRDMKPENLWARDRRVECWRHPAHPSLRIPPFWGGECCSFFSFHSHSPFSNQDSGVLNYWCNVVCFSGCILWWENCTVDTPGSN